eukprot:4721794-Prymnesium_polylepis.1
MSAHASVAISCDASSHVTRVSCDSPLAGPDAHWLPTRSRTLIAHRLGYWARGVSVVMRLTRL